MDGGDMMQALGDGWLGKAIGGLLLLVVGGISGWLTRRPMEAAGFRKVLDESMEAHCARLDKHIADQEAKALAERARCDQELAAMRSEIALMMALSPAATYPHGAAER